MNKEELKSAFNETTDNVVKLLKENVELKKKLEKLIQKYNRNYENGLNDFLELLDVKEENKKLKERINKAIEYIKLKWSYEKLDEVGRNDAIGEAGKTIYEDILREEDTKNVLSILKGEDK